MDSECYLLVHVHAAIVDLVSGDGIHVFHVQAPHTLQTLLLCLLPTSSECFQLVRMLRSVESRLRQSLLCHWSCVVSRSFHNYDFCRDKTCLLRQNVRQNVFVATKRVCCDKNRSCGSSCQ